MPKITPFNIQQAILFCLLIEELDALPSGITAKGLRQESSYRSGQRTMSQLRDYILEPGTKKGQKRRYTINTEHFEQLKNNIRIFTQNEHAVFENFYNF